MTGILNKFYVENGVHGAKVMARSNPLTATCTAEEEVETPAWRTAGACEV